MIELRPTAWLRHFAGLIALAGVLALTACGGGSGAPNNPFTPTPPAAPALTVLPATSTVYSGVPATLTITGGTAPYSVFSSNSAVLPVTQVVAGGTVVLLASDVAADTPVVVTVQDAVGKTATANVTVKPATLLNTFTVTPNIAACGTSAICSGQTGTASITLKAPGGGVGSGRQVRFDVVSGAFSIATNTPAQPFASSVTITSDAAGVAQVVIRADVNAPTQPALLRATDVASGQQQIVQFTIVQNTDGSAILSVVPNTTTITSPFKNECSAGFRVDYFVYGGTPPYRVTPSFPDAITLVNPVVNTAGGFFEAITNGSCVQPLTFSILDATGRQTTATLNNVAGTQDRPGPTPVPPLVLAPSNVALKATSGTCAGSTVNFVVSGGGGSRFAVVSPGTATAGAVDTSTGKFTVTTPSTVAGTSFVVTVGDAAGSSPVTANITCN